jgi:hypothetical protein
VPYPFDSEQQDAIARLIADIKDLGTPFVNGERGNQEAFNKRLNQLQGLIAYLWENKQGSFVIDDIAPAFPAENQVWIDTTTAPPTQKYWDGLTWVSFGSGGGGGASYLDELLDVVATAPATEDVLLYDGTQWVAGPVPARSITFSTYQISVTTSATRIDDALSSDRVYAVENIGTYPIFISDNSGVTTLNGFKIDVDDVFQITLAIGEQLWAVSTLGTVKVSVMKGT